MREVIFTIQDGSKATKILSVPTLYCVGFNGFSVAMQKFDASEIKTLRTIFYERAGADRLAAILNDQFETEAFYVCNLYTEAVEDDD